MPAPIAPWMSASEALTIWMLSTAMKAPSVAPITAIQVLAETPLAAIGGRSDAADGDGVAWWRWLVLMVGLLRLADDALGCEFDNPGKAKALSSRT